MRGPPGIFLAMTVERTVGWAKRSVPTVKIAMRSRDAPLPTLRLRRALRVSSASSYGHKALRRGLDRDRLEVRPSAACAWCPSGSRPASPAGSSPSVIVPVPSRINWISLVLGCMCLAKSPSWIEIVMPSAATYSLERMPPACVRSAERVALEVAGVDDLGGDVLGGDCRTEQMGDAATGGKSGGER